MKREVTTGRVLTLAAAGLTLVGIVLAAVQPAWLTGSLEAAVGRADGAAPLVYLLLCMVAAPTHLSGVVVALSTLTWPLGVALSLSFAGTLLGGLLTASALVRLGGGAQTYRASWPGWLQRLAAGVRQRSLQVGLMARLALGSGAALEAFFVLTGYTRRQYLVSAVLGTALWAAQTLFGVTLLHRLIEVSPGLAVIAAALPLLLVAGGILLRRARS